jgi:hypothetical protein
MMGTPAYMPPEQVLGRQVDARSDLYSTGVVLYRLLAGALPFSADNAVATLQKQVSESPTPLRCHVEGLPGWCERVVKRALAKEPGDRFPSAEAFREALAPATHLSPRDLAKALDVSPGRTEKRAARIPVPKTVVLTPTRIAKAPGRGSTTPRKLRAAGRRGRRMLKDLNRRGMEWTRTRPIGVVVSVSALVGSLTFFALGTPLVRPLKTFPEVRFQGTTVVGSGARQREQEAQLVLADGKVLVMAGPGAAAPLHAVRYRDVFSISYSQGRDPLWASPDGPDLVMRIREDTLEKWGISVQRDWVSLLVASGRPDTGRFIVMRFDDGSIRRVLTALEERTGRKAQILRER